MSEAQRIKNAVACKLKELLMEIAEREIESICREVVDRLDVRYSVSEDIELGVGRQRWVHFTFKTNG